MERQNEVRLLFKNASDLNLLYLRAPINETWLRVCRPSCSAPLTTSLFCIQPGRGNSSGNGFLTQPEGVKGSCDGSLGPISSRRALSIPERLRIVWYWITLIRPLPFSQRHLHDRLTFVVWANIPFLSLQASDEIMIKGRKSRLITSLVSAANILTLNTAALIRGQTSVAVYHFFKAVNIKTSVFSG